MLIKEYKSLAITNILYLIGQRFTRKGAFCPTPLNKIQFWMQLRDLQIHAYFIATAKNKTRQKKIRTDISILTRAWGSSLKKSVEIARGMKWYFLDTTGQLHIWTHNTCDSMNMTCASSSQTKHPGGGERSAWSPTSSWEAIGNW